MGIIETTAKSLLRKQKRIDTWFLSRYGMNLYRGCSHNCAYCDGRSEGYYVKGEFGRDVEVKTNAPDLLRRELDPKRRRKPLKKAYVLIGGGVGDAYQPAEEKYGLARQALEIVKEFGFPIHILTKSCLVENDMDVIERINKKTRAIVSMSFSTVDDHISRVFEPGCSPPSKRMGTLSRFKESGVATGIFLMPVIPFVTDSLESITAVLDEAARSHVDFIIFGGMTLKTGRQRDHFMKVLNKFKPGLEPEYSILYSDNPWGNASSEYYAAVNQAFLQVAANHKIPHRIPPRLYRDILDNNDRVVVMLEHLDYFHRTTGRSSPYRFAANSVSKLTEPISSIRKDLRKLNGVGHATEKIIKEILDTGSCELLDTFF